MDLVNGSRTSSHYDAIYNGYMDLQRMIRKDGFKMIVYPKIEKVLLFDMTNDPEEMNDLSENLDYKAKIDQLFLDLMKLQKDMEDTLDLSKIYNKVKA